MIEPTTFPLSKNVSIQHIKRNWFIDNLYKMTVQLFPIEGLTPLGLRWTLPSNLLTIKWFDAEQVSDVIDQIEYKDESGAEDSDIDDPDEENENVSVIEMI